MAQDTKIQRGGIYIDRDVLKMAKFLADQADSTMTELVEEELRKSLTPKYRKAINREHAELGESGC
jgi:hypothetical protein